MHLQPSCRAGLPPTTMVAEPGAQGAGMTGTHGCGVRTPEAAAVAAATAGFEALEHIPKGGMFLMGMLSRIVAPGVPASNWFSGVTTRALGAAPKLHVIIAPAVTSFGMGSTGLSRFEEANRCRLDLDWIMLKDEGAVGLGGFGDGAQHRAVENLDLIAATRWQINLQNAGIVVTEVKSFAREILHAQKLPQMSTQGLQTHGRHHEYAPVFPPTLFEQPLSEFRCFPELDQIGGDFSQVRLQLSAIQASPLLLGRVELVEQAGDRRAVEDCINGMMFAAEEDLPQAGEVGRVRGNDGRVSLHHHFPHFSFIFAVMTGFFSFA